MGVSRVVARPDFSRLRLDCANRFGRLAGRLGQACIMMKDPEIGCFENLPWRCIVGNVLGYGKFDGRIEIPDVRSAVCGPVESRSAPPLIGREAGCGGVDNCGKLSGSSALFATGASEGFAGGGEAVP